MRVQSTPTNSRPHIVLLQPERDDRDMYAEYLQSRRIVAVPVATAEDALTLAAAADLIVTGILLPGAIDGIEFISRLRADPRTADVPIIVLTSCAWQTERERAERVGCDAFLPKPCLPKDLVRQVRRLIRARRLRRVAGAAVKCDLAKEAGRKTPGTKRTA
jgi:two-component system cell cycle response regulator DivK